MPCSRWRSMPSTLCHQRRRRAAPLEQLGTAGQCSSDRQTASLARRTVAPCTLEFPGLSGIGSNHRFRVRPPERRIHLVRSPPAWTESRRATRRPRAPCRPRPSHREWRPIVDGVEGGSAKWSWPSVAMNASNSAEANGPCGSVCFLRRERKAHCRVLRPREEG
jgi:hypothetical protein